MVMQAQALKQNTCMMCQLNQFWFRRRLRKDGKNGPLTVFI